MDTLLGVAAAYRNGGMEQTTSTVQEVTGQPAGSFRSLLVSRIDQLR